MARLPLMAVLTLVAVSVANTSNARTFVLPHVIESSGDASNTSFAFDTSFQAAYTAGLVDGEPVSNATVNVYLLNAAGAPVVSATANPVCNPCVFVLDSATRRVSAAFQTLIESAGGFAGGVVLGFALFEVTGDDDHVDIGATVVNSHTSPFDLDVAFPDVVELPGGLDPSLRLIVFPSVVESSTGTVNALNAFDTIFYAVYGGGVAGSSIPAGAGATVSLYLFNDNGTLKQSQIGNNVCAPCAQVVSAGSPKATFSLQNLFIGAGGFAFGVEVGFALVSISGTADAVGLQGFFLNSHTSPFDLSTASLEAREVPTSSPPTGVDSPPALDSLLRSYPNPLQGATRIDYTVPSAGEASIEIVDVTGRVVARPVRGPHTSGEHFLDWDGRGEDGRALPSGVYFARLATDAGVRTLKLTLVR
ncbi:MAG TPA: T9SS type A sorting domain-containing protein [Candidatus Krumholzibacteria bacterium]|nr:T9SS type A sorting domain-containing protein [Candidatus Krumholzibacteria bacterium]